MKYNENTSMEPRLLPQLRERLDTLNANRNWDDRSPAYSWINGALCAYEALTSDFQWDLVKIEKRGAELYCIRNEDATEIILPHVCDIFLPA